MSDSVSVDYAVVLIWLAICSLYTTLLTVTALCVVWILRKRRSSILKSQRPARTPFSELEFNVATPTDTAKSRRVSFSKRTGVAEFVTNEATTTWKNFYEEHNKSLESSSNDSEANASRQPVGHLGKRIFDQQFEEVDMDFMSGLVNGSLNNANFSEQLASLECTEGKLTAPNNKFELSAFTEQSKLFGNDFTAPALGENSERIEVNFSTIQQVEKDDLDEIEKDLERGSNNMGCDGSFSDRQNMSEYIEVDLNMTHVVKTDEDMSITDTVHSPVQDVSKSVSIDKKASLNNDWVADKENIVINPYAAPCETNFAVNEEPDQVLVFDGKRLTLQLDKPEKDKRNSQMLVPNSSAETPQRKTIVSNVNDDLPNFLDDMLNSKCEISGVSGFQEIKSNEDEIPDTLLLSKVQHKPKRKTINDNTGNMSMTQALSTNINGNMSMTQALPTSNIGNMSMTQALPTNINGNMSMTQALPTNNIGNMSMTQALPTSNIGNMSMTQALPTSNIGNMSMTQALPTNINGNMSMTQALPTNNIGNMSMTQALPANINGNMSMTQALPTSNIGNMSMTQALPTSIIDQAAVVTQDANLSKERTIVFDKSNNDISVTVTVPVQLLSSSGSMSVRRRTAVYDDNAGNISTTQGVPSNIFVNENVDNAEKDTGNMSIRQTTPAQLIPGYNEDKPINVLNTTKKTHTAIYEDDTGNISITQGVPSNILVSKNVDNAENDTGNMSITQAIPAQLIPGYSKEKPIDVLNTTKKAKNRKRTTIVYDNDDGEISITEAIPVNIIEEAQNERKTIVFDENEANISMTLAISTNVFLLDQLDSTVDVKQPEETTAADVKNPKEPGQPLQDERKIIEDMKECDMSMTMAISKAPSIREIEKGDLSHLQDEQKFHEDNNECDMSMTMAICKAPNLREVEKGDLSVTKPIPAELIPFTEVSDKLIDKLLDLTEPDQIVSHQSDVIVLQSSKNNSKPAPQTNVPEQTELRKIGDIYNDIFKDSSEMKEASAAFAADDVTRSPVGDDGSGASLIIHPRVEEKINQLSLVSTDWRMENIAAGEDDAMMQTDAEEKQESLINTELSLSVRTIDSGTNDKNVMIRLGSTPSPRSGRTKKSSDGNTSNESMFYVTKDNEDDAHTNREKDNDVSKTTKSTEPTYKQLPLVQLEDNLEAVDVLKQKLAELQKAVSQNQSNKFYEKLDTPDLEEVAEFDEDDRNKNNYNKADDTQELLNMLSNLTEPVASDNDIGPGDVKFKGSEIGGLKCLSFAPGRQFVVLSREDLLSNISMAQAALQKSRLALDDSDSPEEDTRDASVDICDKTGRTSNDVVKTLNFNDESISEDSLNEFSPLKKTAFGETSYMHETKGKVIPTYLKDVSDGIKELMLDLVKPVNNDNLPFETGVIDKSVDVPLVNSTHSTQVQANLTTSSQIDVDSNMYSNTDSNTDLYLGTSNKYLARLVRSPVRFCDGNEEWFNTTAAKQSSSVLIFDHLNPLNNIMLPPTNLTEAHKYNPIKSVQTLCVLEPPHQSAPPVPPETHSIGLTYNHSSREDNLRDFEVQTVTTTKQKVLTRSSITQKELNITNTKRKVQEDTLGTQKSKVTPKLSVTKTVKEKKKEPKRNVQYNINNVSNKPLALDQSVDAVLANLKDGEVNTTIAMKQNNELLESSSSLTLVDDALDGQTSPDLPEKEFSNQRIRFSRSHLVNIEEQAAEIDSISEISAISLRENHSSKFNATISKGKKRTYSPSKDQHRQNTSIQVTPKPIAKMQRISNSPKVQIRVPMERSSRNDSAHRMEPEKDENRSGQKSNTSGKKSPKSTPAKPGQNITVRQLIADGISFDTGQKADDLDENKILGILNPKPGSFSEFSQFNVSFTSSKEFKSMKNLLSIENTEEFSTQVGPSQADWHSELMMNSTSSSQCDAESGVNVVAKIDMLPFMGSHECEWESSSRADSWSFRLLHGRLRLTARLAHRVHNSTRTRVRGDTPVLDITVEAVQQDKKNPVAILCVRFACETMRHLVARALRNKCLARDIPPLLRRCAAVVRVALRWGRAMHDAKLHLAYTIDTDGNLSLKVANVPLRSVWEVTMRIEMALEDEHSVPIPSACDVHVLPIVSDVVVPDADVQCVLDHTPKDWGHVPKIIWRVFRLLKHKKRDDELVLS